MTNLVTIRNSNVQTTKQVVFAGSTTSGAEDLTGQSLVGIVTPAGMAGTSLAVHASETLSGTYIPVVDSSNAPVVFTIDNLAKWRVAGANLQALAGLNFVKLVSPSSETATVKLVTRVL